MQRTTLLRRNSALFPYIRAAAFSRANGDELRKSVLAQYAGGEFPVLQLLLRGLSEGIQIPGDGTASQAG